MLPRPTTLLLTELEGRLALSGQTASALAAQAPQPADADTSPTPVLVGTDPAGEAVYTLTVAPGRSRCGCAACRGLAAATVTAAQPTTQTAFVQSALTAVVPIAAPTPDSPPTNPPQAPDTPPAVVGSSQPDTPVTAPAGAAYPQPAAPPQADVPSGRPAPDRLSSAFAVLAEADMSSAFQPDAIITPATLPGRAVATNVDDPLVMGIPA